MAKCATGIVLNIAKPSAVTPAVALANIPLGVQRFGSIDRQGNKHVRVLLVEAVWRLLKWQPQWHARQKYLAKLKHGASLKKKIAIALARQLAIDLWRWRTGRATAAELGWTLKNAMEETTPL